MMQILGGSAHAEAPGDLAQALIESTWGETWSSLTPLGRNEWICWVISVKQPATRQKHITRAVEQLAAGKRRPCCWMGCIHRTDKEISPSVRGILQKRGPL